MSQLFSSFFHGLRFNYNFFSCSEKNPISSISNFSIANTKWQLTSTSNDIPLFNSISFNDSQTIIKQDTLFESYYYNIIKFNDEQLLILKDSLNQYGSPKIYKIETKDELLILRLKYYDFFEKKDDQYICQDINRTNNSYEKWTTTITFLSSDSVRYIFDNTTNNSSMIDTGYIKLNEYYLNSMIKTDKYLVFENDSKNVTINYFSRVE